MDNRLNKQQLTTRNKSNVSSEALQYRQDVFPIAHYHVQQKKSSLSIHVVFILLYQWKQKGIGLLYKHLPLHPNCVSTLPGKTKTTYKQHILKPIITVHSITTSAESRPMFIFSNFCRKFFYQSSSRRKTFTFSWIL